jgi:hypothetical protein
VKIAQAATYEVGTEGYKCSEATVNGQRILTCTGPGNSSGEVSVCNASCNAQPSQTGARPTCDPGYAFDASTGTCLYSPASREPGVGGCPPGYNVVDRGSHKVCALGLSQNGQCPLGTYFDGQAGGCVSPASADAPYGINDTATASRLFQGCAAGYSYDAQYQCCQASAGGAYPGCALGFKYDVAQKTCIPEQVRRSAEPGTLQRAGGYLQQDHKGTGLSAAEQRLRLARLDEHLLAEEAIGEVPRVRFQVPGGEAVSTIEHG